LENPPPEVMTLPVDEEQTISALFVSNPIVAPTAVTYGEVAGNDASYLH